LLVGGSRSKIPVCSTTRVKSAIVFSLMVDGKDERETKPEWFTARG